MFYKETSTHKTIILCKELLNMLFFPPPSSAIKSIQVEDCCMCRWFGEASIFVSGAIMQTFHTGTLHEQRRHMRGGVPRLRQRLVFWLKSEKQHPSEDAVGMNDIIHSPLVALSVFLYITLVQTLLQSIK